MAKTSNVTKQSKGGEARKEKLSPEQRSEIAKKAADARWGKTVPVATHGSPDHPLKIGETEIPCYVLDDGRRVLHQRGMVSALGMSRGSSGGTGGDRLAKFVAGDRLKPFVGSHLIEVTSSPIRFRISSGNEAYGYEATVLADICEAVLSLRESGNLQHQQEHIAQQCEVLMRGFARVGIIALVDEATGYQYERARTALEEILEAFISEELRRWVRTFPASYFKHLCRLRNVDFRSDMRLPPYFGHLTNDIVYSRLAPGVLEELKARTPKSEQGNAKNKLFQWLSGEVGHPKLVQHLGAVIGLMKVSDDYEQFKGLLDRAAPVYKDASLFVGADED